MAQIRLFPLLVVVVLAACTGDDDVATSTTSSTTTTMALEVAPVENLADAYFDALAVGGVAESAAATAAVPGSDAALYAEHQAAARDLLGVTTTRTLVVDRSGFEICDLDAACTTYSSVVSDPVSGLVTGFSIDDVPVAGRIVGGGLVADRGGAIARVASAYQTNDGDVFVVVEVDNTTDVPIEIFGFAGVLTEAGGTSVEATGAWGSQQFPAATDGELLLQFPAADLGGLVQLSGLRGDGLDLSIDLRVPTST